MIYNFKAIKDLSTQLLFENIVTTKVTNFSYNKFINEVKKSPILKTQFIVYNNIESERFNDRGVADKFLEENLSLFKKYTKKEILEENKKLGLKLFKDSLISESEDDLFDLILESTKDSKIKDITKKANLFSNIVETLVEKKEIINESDKVDLEINPNISTKKVIKRATEILNEKYSFFSDEELNILKSYLNKDMVKKEELYNQLITENLKLVKRKLFEEDKFDKEEIDSLNLTEAKLKESIFKEDTEIGEFSKLLELKESLKD